MPKTSWRRELGCGVERMPKAGSEHRMLSCSEGISITIKYIILEKLSCSMETSSMINTKVSTESAEHGRESDAWLSGS
jgi:hypothetical protein